MNGFLNLLKPAGMTSAACVGYVKRMSGEKRVGHAGTLDPEAVGVLPIMIGRATRLFDALADKEKVYVAEVAFGQATDTQDASGAVTAEGMDYPDAHRVREAADRLTGEIEQRPSVYSAIHQDGKRLYELARAGIQVEAPVRTVTVSGIELLHETPRHGYLIRVICGRGTYIRTLCHDLGVLCGCPAHMRFLLREKTGAFSLDTAVTLEEAHASATAGTLDQLLIPMDAPLCHLPCAYMPTGFAKAVRNGMKLPARFTDAEEGATVRIYLQGAFWGLAVRRGDELTWQAQLPPEG